MKNTLVLGASLNPSRYSNFAIQRLLHFENQVFAIGNKNGIVNGVEINTEKIKFDKIDTITLYINPKRQKEYYNYVISLQPKRVIFNPGTENPEFYKLLKQNNIPYEIACTLVMLSTNQY